MQVPYVPPAMGEPPFRAIVLGRFQPGWYLADDSERERALPRMKAVFDRWEEEGARLVGSLDDDFFMVGPSPAHHFSLYLMYDLPSLDVVPVVLQMLRETVDGARIDRYLHLEVRVGRRLFLVSDWDRA